MRLHSCLIIATIFAGCNSNLKVHTSGGDVDSSLEVPEEETTEDDAPEPEFVGEFAFARSYVQSRSAILLEMDSDILEQGERFSLWNETNKAKILDSEQASLALTNGGFVSLAAGYSIYQLAPAGYSGVLEYGTNNIRLDIGDEYAPRYATATLVLRDFPIFEVAATHFDENVQVKGNFQGWLNTVAQPSVSAQGTILTVGLPNIVNR